MIGNEKPLRFIVKAKCDKCNEVQEYYYLCTETINPNEYQGFARFMWCKNCKSLIEVPKEAVDSFNEYSGYIESQTCCACTHFHWGMGEMGFCDAEDYKDIKEIGEWCDTCTIEKFNPKSFCIDLYNWEEGQ